MRSSIWAATLMFSAWVNGSDTSGCKLNGPCTRVCLAMSTNRLRSALTRKRLLSRSMARQDPFAPASEGRELVERAADIPIRPEMPSPALGDPHKLALRVRADARPNDLPAFLALALPADVGFPKGFLFAHSRPPACHPEALPRREHDQANSSYRVDRLLRHSLF